MATEIEKMSEDVELVSKLGDQPNLDDGLSAEDLKKVFDRGPALVKEYVNGTVVPAINKLLAAAGDGGAGVFIAVYDQTTNAEILAAHKAGKLVFAQDGGGTFLFPAVMIREGSAQFICYTGNRAHSMSCVNDVWSADTRQVEDTANKVTVIDENSTDAQYPTAKAVEARIAKIAGGGTAESDPVKGIAITEHLDGSVTMVAPLASGATDTLVIGADENGDPNSLTYNGVAIPFSYTVETAQAAEEIT